MPNEMTGTGPMIYEPYNGTGPMIRDPYDGTRQDSMPTLEMTAGEAVNKLKWLAEHILADDCMNMPDCKQAAEMGASILRCVESGELREVVFCKDCQYRNKVECPAYRKLVDTGEIITPPYVRFCSYGARKEKDDA